MQIIQEQTATMEAMVADILTEAQQLGTSAAEAAVIQNTGFSVNVRMGQVETVEYTKDRSLGITVYFGTSKGTASTTDLGLAAIRDTVAAACKIAKYTQGDPCNGLADPELMAQEIPNLDLHHTWPIDTDQAIQLAVECEATARQFDARITNSEGAAVDSHAGLYVYGNSHGFIGSYPSTMHGISCTVLSSDTDGTQRDYWWTRGHSHTEMELPTSVGSKAAARALARLGSRAIKTCTAPVILQADIAGGLLRNFISAINGHKIYRQSSFLLDHLDKPIFPEFVNIYERPHIKRGIGSAPFDGEGVATKAKDLITNGILQSYILDSYAARKLGMQSTGNAGGVHNIKIDVGSMDLQQLLTTMGTGVLVTEILGQGVNLVTGDYSRGAAGFWVEQGNIAYPIEGITIAGNLKDMFMGLQAIGHDIDTRQNIQTGSWLLSPMTIAGN
ncbi:peptidase PmbA [Achromatium sp. WMS2]|nr:peptidase PmbA [Achromatium sp. WMS2]